MTIQYHEQLRIFAIQTQHSSYIFGINEREHLQHLYWGDPVSIEDSVPLLHLQSHSSFDAEVEGEVEEYSFWGGASYTEPSLKLRMSDGVRDLQVRYDCHEIIEQDGRQTLIITLKDQVYALETQLVYRVIPEFDLVERYANIVNKGQEDIVLESMQSAAWTLPYLQDYRLTHVTGKWSGEFQLRNTILTEGKRYLNRGEVSLTVMPTHGLRLMMVFQPKQVAEYGLGHWLGAVTGRLLQRRRHSHM